MTPDKISTGGSAEQSAGCLSAVQSFSWSLVFVLIQIKVVKTGEMMGYIFPDCYFHSENPPHRFSNMQDIQGMLLSLLSITSPSRVNYYKEQLVYLCLIIDYFIEYYCLIIYSHKLLLPESASLPPRNGFIHHLSNTYWERSSKATNAILKQLNNRAFYRSLYTMLYLLLFQYAN